MLNWFNCGIGLIADLVDLQMPLKLHTIGGFADAAEAAHDWLNCFNWWMPLKLHKIADAAEAALDW